MKGLATIVLLAKTYQGLISWVCRHCGVPFDSQRCFFVERKFTPKTRGCNSAEIWTLRKTSTFNNPNQKWTCGSMFLGDIFFHLPSSEANFLHLKHWGWSLGLTNHSQELDPPGSTWTELEIHHRGIERYCILVGRFWRRHFFFLKGLPNP